MARPERWSDPKNKLFPHTVGAHGRLLHVPDYSHQLTQRADRFALLDEVVYCFSNAGADVVGQVGTNWVHAGGRDVNERTWIFPGELALRSTQRTLEQAPHVDAVLVNGMCNFRDESGVPRRFVGLAADRSFFEDLFTHKFGPIQE